MEATSDRLLRNYIHLHDEHHDSPCLHQLPSSSSGGSGPDSDAPSLPKRLIKREFVTSPFFNPAPYIIDPPRPGYEETL